MDVDIESHIINNHNNINKIMLLLSGSTLLKSGRCSNIYDVKKNINHIQREKIKNSNIEYLNFLNSIIKSETTNTTNTTNTTILTKITKQTEILLGKINSVDYSIMFDHIIKSNS